MTCLKSTRASDTAINPVRGCTLCRMLRSHILLLHHVITRPTTVSQTSSSNRQPSLAQCYHQPTSNLASCGPAHLLSPSPLPFPYELRHQPLLHVCRYAESTVIPMQSEAHDIYSQNQSLRSLCKAPNSDELFYSPVLDILPDVLHTCHHVFCINHIVHPRSGVWVWFWLSSASSSELR